MKRVVVSTLALAGCYQHVVLPTPAPTLTPDQRVAMFTQYQPVTDRKVTTCTNNGGCSTHESIALANGLEVHYPEDLLPMVRPDSATAHYTAEADHDQNLGDGLALGGLIGVLGGAGFFVNRAVAAGPEGSISSFDKTASLALRVGGLIRARDHRYFHAEAASDRSTVYASFRRDLGERLNVCVSGYAVVACEAPPQPPQPPPPPQPIR